MDAACIGQGVEMMVLRKIQSDLAMLRPGVLALAVLISVYLACCCVFQYLMHFDGNCLSIYPQNLMDAPSAPQCALIIVLSVLVFVLLIALMGRLAIRAEAARAEAASRVNSDPPSTASSGSLSKRMAFARFLRVERRWSWGLVLGVFLCWLAVFLNYCPGTSMNDQILIVMDPVAQSGSNPFLYCFLLGGLVRWSYHAFGNGNIGFATFVCLDMLLCAIIVMVCAQWLRHKGSGDKAAIAFAAVFALLPVIQNYAICSIKDTLFSFVLLLWLPFLFEYVGNQSEFWMSRGNAIALIALCCLTSFTRNNGPYIVAGILFVLLLASWGKEGMRRFLGSVLLVASIVAASGALAKTFAVAPQRFGAMTAIPIQQMAAVVSEGGAIPSEDDEALLEGVFDCDLLPSCYAPAFVDVITFNRSGAVFKSEYLEQHRGAFLRTWLNLGIHNPGTYCRAWLSATYGCWALAEANMEQSYFFSLSSNLQNEATLAMMDQWGLGNQSMYPNPIAHLIDKVYPLMVICPNTGFLFAVVLLLGLAICAIENDARYFLIAIACLFLWVSLMLSVPLSGALRYGVHLLFAIPMLCVMVPLAARDRIEALPALPRV